MVSRVIPVEAFDLVVFEGQEILPDAKFYLDFFRRFVSGQMPKSAQIIAAARSDFDTSRFLDVVSASINEFAGIEFASEMLQAFLENVRYVKIDAMGSDGWDDLKGMMRGECVSAFYFSVSPALFGPLAERLKTFGIADDQSRVVVEKPFGRDLASARELNQTLAHHFREDQIYRIDHYLGKETVQNLMAVRFGNMLFEPLWNAQYIDHIQITVAEQIDVEGRGDYYDKSGAMRDMVQNHLMQLLCLIAMEPPFAIFTRCCAR